MRCGAIVYPHEKPGNRLTASGRTLYANYPMKKELEITEIYNPEEIETETNKLFGIAALFFCFVILVCLVLL